MIVLVSGATATLRRYAHTGIFGQLMMPRSGNRPGDLVWACDNDAFNGFHEGRFRKMLTRITPYPGCKFVACPDVVCDPVETLRLFDLWAPEIEQPLAFVGQDGIERMTIPWDRFDTFFVGGSTEWKESKTAMMLCDEAKERGKWVHVGRVNSFRRVKKLWDWGSVDSIDGTCFSRYSNVFMPKFVAWISELSRQPSLF